MKNNIGKLHRKLQIHGFYQIKISPENFLMLIGLVLIGTAFIIPFKILDSAGKSFSTEDFIDLGVIGDFFGGTTVGILSLASMIFVISAIVMQKEELSLQREELKKTREEYKLSNTTLKKQQFETTFFNMINLHHSILNSISFDGIRGRLVFQSFHNELKSSYFDNFLNEINEIEKKRLLENKDKEKN